MEKFIVRRRDTDEYIYNYCGFVIYSDNINDASRFDKDDEELQYYINSPDKFMVYSTQEN